MSSTDYITRKEFEEWKGTFMQRYEDRHIAISNQLTESLGIMRNNQAQITELTSDIKELWKTTEEHGRQIVKTSTYNKILWPVVSAALTVVGILVGVHL